MTPDAIAAVEAVIGSAALGYSVGLAFGVLVLLVRVRG